MRTRFAPLLLGLAACAPAARPSPTPAPSVPPVASDTSARTVVVRPDTTPLDTMVSYRVPPFKPLPLIPWGAPPPGEPHAERVRTYDLQHQVVHVRFDWARHAVVGTTMLRVAALPGQPLSDVALDAIGMTFSAVRDATGRPLRYDYDGRTLTVHLAAPVRPGHVASFTVAYETVQPKKGAYFIDRKHIVWTQGEMIDTRYWVPTYDEPNDKTTWEFYIRTAKGERALSNGVLADSQPGRDAITWHWVLKKPASTYLMTAVTGNFTVLRDTWHGTPVDYWTYPDSVRAAWRGFGVTPRAVEIFSKKTGVPYPWRKYDQVVAPDYIFGGMENVTATTQADDDILHPAWAEPQANADGLVAHELGHQWYGDLLTLEDWSDAWLNEGFATFMEQIFQEEYHGKDEGAIDRRSAHEQTIAADERARRPLVYSRWSVDPLELFLSGHIYPRGASVLQMLRHQLGDSLFWAAMHTYTVKHAYGNVTSADLRDAFEQVTGRNLHPFFDQWVYGAGEPLFRVSYAYDSASRQLTLDARETQPRDSLTGSFDADVDVEVLTDSGAVEHVVPVRMGAGHVAIALPAPPRAIEWDKGDWLLDVTDFPRPTVMLAYQLAHDDDVTGRLEAIELLSERTADPKALPSLATAARHDAFWAVRQAAAEALSKFAPSNSGRALRSGAETIARAALIAAVGDSDARVRQAAASSLASFPGPDVVSALRGRTNTDSSYFVRGAALIALAKVDPTAATPAINEALHRDSWLDIARTAGVRALAYVPTEAAWDTLLTFLAPSVVRETREAAIASLLARSKGREAALAQALVPVLDAPDFYSRVDAAVALGRLKQAASIAPLEARRKVEAESRVINAIDAAVAEIRAAQE
ncbi:MAG TPA: M1 family aminopeptidase [Gemmatimonadaceae bacterium]